LSHAIENTPQEAENMKIRGALMEKLIDFIDDSGMPQGEIAERLGVSQPRISDLVRGKIDLFSIDALVNMLVAAGLKVDLCSALCTNPRQIYSEDVGRCLPVGSRWRISQVWSQGGCQGRSSVARLQVANLLL
jgi:predicted XRE-type DNA-binding protein